MCPNNIILCSELQEGIIFFSYSAPHTNETHTDMITLSQIPEDRVNVPQIKGQWISYHNNTVLAFTKSMLEFVTVCEDRLGFTL